MAYYTNKVCCKCKCQMSAFSDEFAKTGPNDIHWVDHGQFFHPFSRGQHKEKPERHQETLSIII